MDDRELLSRFIERASPDDFSELVRRYAPLVFASASRQLRDPHAAQDVTQAVFLLLSQKAKRIKGPLAGWLLTTTRLTARNAMKLSNRRQFHEQAAARERRESIDNEPHQIWEEYAPLLDDAMSRLSRSQRDCIAMRFLRGLTLEEVAAMLGISKAAAQKRVNRSVLELRRHLLGASALPSVAGFADLLAAHGSISPPAMLLGSSGSDFVKTVALNTASAMRWAQAKFVATIAAVLALAGGGALIALAIDRGTVTTAPATMPAIVATTAPAVPAGVTPITLDVTDIDARAALAEISRQAGVPIALSPATLWSGTDTELSYRVSLHLNRAPFWSSLAQLCGQTLSIPRPANNSQVISISNAGGDESNSQLGGIMSTSGAFTFVASRITHRRAIELANAYTTRDDQLSLAIFVDPKTRLLLHGTPWLDTANDENGRSYIAQSQDQNESLHHPFFCNWMISEDVPLRFPTSAGKRLPLLKGEFRVVTQTQSVDVSIDDLQHSVNKPETKAARTITLLSCLMQSTTGSMTFNITRAGQPPAVSDSLLEDATHDISIYDADGKAIKADFTGSSNDNQAKVDCQLSQPTPIKQPLRLVWTITTESAAQTVPFEFHDVPLPAE